MRCKQRDANRVYTGFPRSCNRTVKARVCASAKLKAGNLIHRNRIDAIGLAKEREGIVLVVFSVRKRFFVRAVASPEFLLTSQSSIGNPYR